MSKNVLATDGQGVNHESNSLALATCVILALNTGCGCSLKADVAVACSRINSGIHFAGQIRNGAFGSAARHLRWETEARLHQVQRIIIQNSAQAKRQTD
jgi:hypothetical protein